VEPLAKGKIDLQAGSGVKHFEAHMRTLFISVLAQNGAQGLRR
jgi:hypothetical protein